MVQHVYKEQISLTCFTCFSMFSLSALGDMYLMASVFSNLEL